MMIKRANLSEASGQPCGYPWRLLDASMIGEVPG
jgi:hypothetical protein